MELYLSANQLRALQNMNNYAKKDFEDGRAGVIFAQLKVNNGFMVVRYIEHDKAMKIQEIIGEQEVGKTC